MKIRFPRNALWLIFLNFISSIGIFMTAPFFAIYLKTSFNISSSHIGLIIGLPVLIGCFLGFVGGYIADRFGHVKILIVGIFISATGYFIYFIASSVVHLFTAGCILGLSRILTQPSIKSLLSSCKLNGSSSSFFRLRHLSFCIAAVIGPAAGVYIAQHDVTFVFLTSSCIFLTASTITFIFRKQLPHIQHRQNAEPVLKFDYAIIKNFRLALVTLSGFLTFFVFAQFETAIPLVLSTSSSKPESLFSILFISNAILGICFQLAITFASRRSNSSAGTAILGSISFCIAFLIFAYAKTQLMLLLLATTVFTLGESLVLPAGDVLIDQLSPQRNKACYYGIGELRYLGFVMGPVIAGALLDKLGSAIMYYAAAVVSVLAGLGYSIVGSRSNLAQKFINSFMRNISVTEETSHTL